MSNPTSAGHRPTLETINPPLRTAAWYGDPELPLAFPSDWEVAIHWPATPDPMSHDEMVAAVRGAADGPQLADLAAGAGSVAIIVDDLTRPTPADAILPVMLDELASAGVAAENITIVIGNGTHGPSTPDALRRKVGSIAERCRVVPHDDRRDCERIGHTSFGSPVWVNRHVLAADLVIGLGGVYPQHSTGFGGGVKTVLGALGRQSITRLHFGHDSMNGSYETDNTFRADVAEMARLAGLRWTAAAHVDAERRVVHLAAGDPERIYPAAVAASRALFAAPLPGDADVVVSNAYPMDVSATFMRSKGVTPLNHAKPGASRVLLAACSDGMGHHGLFPFVETGNRQRALRLVRRVRARGWAEMTTLGPKLLRRVRRRGGAPDAPRQRRILLHQTVDPVRALPDELPGMTPIASWSDVLDAIEHEQGRRDGLRVVVYPCAPLQVLEA